jgi:crossover junction endodeoxyribonuclease RuvC
MSLPMPNKQFFQATEPVDQTSIKLPSGSKIIRVLGVDPGFGRTGLGVVDYYGSKPVHVWHSCIDTPADAPFTERLQTVRNDLTEALRRFAPHVAAVEKLFFQSNVKTAINVGMARGVILLVLADAGLISVELNPNNIKQAVAGHGSADKKQIQDMVMRLLKLESIPKPDDAADALAIAIAGGLYHITESNIRHKSR